MYQAVVKMPGGGIADLKQVAALSEKVPAGVPNATIVPAHSMIDEAYEATGTTSP